MFVLFRVLAECDKIMFCSLGEIRLAMRRTIRVGVAGPEDRQGNRKVIF